MPAGPFPSSPQWGLVASDYAAGLTPVFEHFSRDALQLASLLPGERVLDVATGPGTLAVAAARRGARVRAIDCSPQMLEQFRARASAEGGDGLVASIGDGQALSFADRTFDAAFSMFGLIYFPNRAKGFRELHRVLRPGGRAVVSSWASSMKHTPFLAALWASARAALPLFFSPDGEPPLTHSRALRQEMRASGFKEVHVGTVHHAVPFASPGAAWTWFSRLSPSLVMLRRFVGARAWRAFSARTRRGLEASLGVGEVHMEFSAHLGLGWK